MMDRHARRILEAAARGALEEASPTGSSRVYFDEIGPAVYQTEPQWRTAILCLRCGFVALVISLPRKRLLTWECSKCGWVVPLAPPAAVLEVPDPAHPRMGTMGRPRASTPLEEHLRRRLT